MNDLQAIGCGQGRSEGATLLRPAFSFTRKFMGMSIPSNAKKRGRPPGRDFPVFVGLRLSEDQAERLDAWRAAQPDTPSRSEAIRRLVETGLKKER